MITFSTCSEDFYREVVQHSQGFSECHVIPMILPILSLLWFFYRFWILYYILFQGLSKHAHRSWINNWECELFFPINQLKYSSPVSWYFTPCNFSLIGSEGILSHIKTWPSWILPHLLFLNLIRRSEVGFQSSNMAALARNHI